MATVIHDTLIQITVTTPDSAATTVIANAVVAAAITSAATPSVAVTVGLRGLQGVPGADAPAIGMSGDRITIAGVPVGDHLTGPAPTISMSGDQVMVSGVIIGPHLTGPAGDVSNKVDTTDPRLSDARTPASHNNTYHSTAYTPQSTAVNGHALSANVTVAAGDIPITVVGTPTMVTSVTDFMDMGWSAGVVSGAGITDNADGTITIAAGEALLRLSASSHDHLVSIEFSEGADLVPTDGSVTYFFVSYNNGSPVIQQSTIATSFNCLEKCHICTVARDGVDLYILDAREQNVDSNRKARIKNYQTDTYRHIIGGSALSSTGLAPYLSAGGFWFSYVRIPHDAFDVSLSGTTVDRVFTYYYQNSGWVHSHKNKTLDNTKFNNGTSGLQALATDYYGVHWAYLSLGLVPQLIIIYGSGDYATLVAAQNASAPASLPPVIAGTGVLLGRYIVKKGASSPAVIESAFELSFAPSSGVPLSVAGSNGQLQYNDTGVLAADENLTWAATEQSLNIGQSTILVDNPLAISGTSATYVQVNLQNKESHGSMDLILTASDGTNEIKYADVGITNPDYTSSYWPLFPAWSMYIFPERSNLYLGTLDTTGSVEMFVATTTGEAHAEDVVCTVNHTGVNIPAGNAFMVNNIDVMDTANNFALAIATSMAMGGF